MGVSDLSDGAGSADCGQGSEVGNSRHVEGHLCALGDLADVLSNGLGEHIDWTLRSIKTLIKWRDFWPIRGLARGLIAIGRVGLDMLGSLEQRVTRRHDSPRHAGRAERRCSH